MSSQVRTTASSPKPGGGSAGTGTPRYLEVAAELEQEIKAGVHPVGSTLPPESELVTRFGVSRFTVREAFRRLADLGLISRQQGARAKVIGDQVEPAFSAIPFTIEPRIDFGASYSPRYLDTQQEELVTARGSAARFLRCRPGRDWRVLRGPRRDGATHEVVAWCEVYLWADLDARDLETSRTIASQVAERNGLEIMTINIEFAAVALTEEQAELLASEPGAPGLEVVRRFMVARGRAFQVLRNVYKGGTVNYSMMFDRRNAVALPVASDARSE